MSRLRLTQVFPFLLPLRQWQRKKFFYRDMRRDGNHYAKTIGSKELPHLVFETSQVMVNHNSGFDIRYQYNKVHNLKLAAATIHGLIIRPGETFSFWQRVRKADEKTAYKDGLDLVNGKIVGSYGGGICQLSNLLHWMFLHSPLSVTERHSHDIDHFAPASESAVFGIDATISEGWLDLKVRNDTPHLFQIALSFDEEKIIGRIFSDSPSPISYQIFNSHVSYQKIRQKLYQDVVVSRREIDKERGEMMVRELYQNRCEIAYELPLALRDHENNIDSSIALERAR